LNFQSEKKLVLDFYEALQNCKSNNMSEILSLYCSEDLLWRGFHPFNEIIGTKNLNFQFWIPLRNSLSNLQRRIDIFLAGINKISGNEGVWVISMGHLMGLFDKPWLGIKETKKIGMLRYCEFCKVENNKITEIAMFFDIPHFMLQSGLKVFPVETGISLIQPGPLNNDGLMYEIQDPNEGNKTSEIIEKMIRDLVIWKNFDKVSLKRELKKSWNEDMIWWGPTGIGASFTIDRYIEQHAQPFRKTFINRKFNGHICRISEGMYGGFFGWPNLTLTPQKNFMGLKTLKKSSEMRVIDIYRRRGNKLAENWIFIDFLHFWKIQGIDILKVQKV